MRTLIINKPVGYASWLELPDKFYLNADPPFDFVHLFTNRLQELETNLATLRASLNPSGMVWVSWYKTASRLPTEITEDLIRATCLPLGVVDIKVCSVNEEWSGLKLGMRKDLR